MKTEEEVLKDFEKLGCSADLDYTFNHLHLYNGINQNSIMIDIKNKRYFKYDSEANIIPTTIQEHKLLTELFQIWEWL